MKPSTKKTLAAMAIVATSASAVSVKADEVTQPVTSPAPVESTVAKEVTKADVDKATKSADDAKAALDAQAQVVSDLEAQAKTNEADITTAEEAVTEAREVADVANSDANAVETAETAAETAKEELTQLEADEASAKDEETKAQAAYDEAEKAVAESEANLDQAVVELKEAENHVAELEKGIDTTDLAADVMAKEKALTETVNAKNEAQKAYDAAVKADSDKATAIKEATETVSLNEGLLANDTAALKVADTKVADTKAELDKVTAEKEKAQKLYDITKALEKSLDKNSDYWKAFYNSMEEYKTDEEQDAFDEIIMHAHDRVQKLFNQLLELEEEGPMVDPTNLTDEQIEELTKFVLTALNPIREGRGVKPLAYHPIVPEITNAVAKYRTEHKKTFERENPSLGHTSADEYANILSQINKDVEYYVELGVLTPLKEKSLKDLKRDMLIAMQRFMFADEHAGWDHMKHLLALADPQESYGILTLANAKHDKQSNTAFTYYTFAKDSNLHNDLELVGGSAVTNNFNELTMAVNKAQAAYDMALIEQAEGKTRVETAKARLDQSKALLNELTSGEDQLAKAAKTLTDAVTAVTTAEKALTESQDALNAANTLKANREAELFKAIEARDAIADSINKLEGFMDMVNIKKSNLTHAKENLDAKRDAAKAAEAARMNGEAKAKAAADYVIALKNAPQRLEEAEHKLAVAKKALKDTLAELETAREALKDAESKNQDAQAEKARVLDLYKKAQAEAARLEALRKEREELARQKEAEVKTKDNVAVTLPDGSQLNLSTITDKTTSTSDSGRSEQLVATPQTSYARRSERHQLPKTGDKTSLLTFWGLTAVFGLVRIKGRRSY